MKTQKEYVLTILIIIADVDALCRSNARPSQMTRPKILRNGWIKRQTGCIASTAGSQAARA